MEERGTPFDSTAGYAAAFIAGLVIGTLATGGLLMYMAPASSKKVREEVTHRSKKLRDQAYDRADDLRENANDWMSFGRSKGKRWARQARDIREDAKDTLEELQKRGRRQAKQQSKSARGFVGAGRRIIDRVLG